LRRKKMMQKLSQPKGWDCTQEDPILDTHNFFVTPTGRQRKQDTCIVGRFVEVLQRQDLSNRAYMCIYWVLTAAPSLSSWSSQLALPWRTVLTKWEIPHYGLQYSLLPKLMLQS
jgi:hypothetical protein